MRPTGTSGESEILIGAAAVVGVGFVVGGPAQLSLVPDLVRPEELQQAVALNALPTSVARAVGPPLGSLIYVAFGPTAAFATAALANLLFAAIILRLPSRPRRNAAATRSGVLDGLAYLRSDPRVGLLLLGILAVGIGADPVVTLTPAIATKLQHGEGLVGVLAAAFGGGAVVAQVGIHSLQRRVGIHRLTTTGLLMLALGMASTGLSPNAPLVMIALTCAGVGFGWGLTGATTLVYEVVDPEYRGRVMSLWLMAFVGSRPIGALISGIVADTQSLEAAHVVVGGTVALLALAAQIGTRATLRET